MRWNDLKIGKKIMISSGSILFLLIVVGVWAFWGLGSVVHDGIMVADGNALRGELLQREVDHLNWAKKVSAYMYDGNITELGVELDHTKCGFGKWYYGEGRKEAESLLPILREPLADIADPHQKLHESASKIKEVFHKKDNQLGRQQAEVIYNAETQDNLAKV